MHYCMEKFNLTCYGELYNKSLKLEDEEPLKEDAEEYQVVKLARFCTHSTKKYMKLIQENLVEEN